MRPRSSQKQIAFAAQISGAYLSEIIKGRKRPKGPIAKRLADVTGIEPAVWLEGSPEEIRQALEKASHLPQADPAVSRGNANHPRLGDRITVEPIREIKHIKAIKRLLADRPRDLALFVTGINTNLRASDLLRITIGQVRGKMPMEEIFLLEKKTGKPRRINLNAAVVEAVSGYIENNPGEDSERLFRGQRGPLTEASVHRLVSQWCREINLMGNYGSHTLRKTWGYMQRTVFGVSLPELMTVFGHSTQQQTLAYLCVQADEIRAIYGNEL